MFNENGNQNQGEGLNTNLTPETSSIPAAAESQDLQQLQMPAASEPAPAATTSEVIS
jgi:hypothetical protein